MTTGPLNVLLGIEDKILILILKRLLVKQAAYVREVVNS